MTCLKFFYEFILREQISVHVQKWHFNVEGVERLGREPFIFLLDKPVLLHFIDLHH